MPRLKALKLKMPFGARMIKTAIAVMLSFYIAHKYQLNAVVAVISAIINVQPTLSRSLRNAIEQIIVHVVGMVIGLGVGYLWAPGPLAMGVATPLVIWSALRLGYGEVAMALLPMVIILSSPEEAFLTEALYRSIVIFLGLGVGIAVNGLIAPPRYRDRLLTRLQELNDVTVDFFGSLANDFTVPKLIPYEEYEKKRLEVKSLLKECRLYLELWREQLGQKRTPFPWQDQLIEQYIDFNTNLYHKSKDIFENTRERIAWREQMGQPIITPEFEAILAMLQHGIDDFRRLNNQLRMSMFKGVPAQHYPVDDKFWQEMSDYVDLWHEKLTGAYYMHALLFLAVVANNLKYANRTVKEYLNIIHENQDIASREIRKRLDSGL
ncbi:membrane protein-like protein [Desulforamulus reducens MI-1]|uniref:Membrane protein-like protein n=1 Tax=Desulforamulus reducens (strain ATCC BAA-1160 / DSM 100696 / MI-1) TaxID=349161 RepID=A4J4G5_DESRM|nr:aromatic acid exporter family protein [Desulforamulus reducens]ABO49968.1 membrane protein-like protein [Desulforamulus reducens MI-1]